ncbi:MAG: HIT family protein [Candidatus Pacebacteria bacterium]|nr:HIT family protein [Candidatus Paceibacterota bacterium]
MSDGCIFCSIVAGTAPAFVVWEDMNYMAFLTPFPNTEGFTVVIPKAHYESYIFEAPDDVIEGIMQAAKHVALKIDSAFPDVRRTAVIFEGFGVNHLHAKLFPMHGTVGDEWKQHVAKVDTYFTRYEGYISSHNYQRADDAALAVTAEKIRSAAV